MWETPTYLESSDFSRIIPVSSPYPPAAPQFSISLLLKSSSERNSKPPFTLIQTLRERVVIIQATLQSPIRKIKHSGRTSLHWYPQLKTKSQLRPPLNYSSLLFFYPFSPFLLSYWLLTFLTWTSLKRTIMRSNKLWSKLNKISHVFRFQLIVNPLSTGIPLKMHFWRNVPYTLYLQKSSCK